MREQWPTPWLKGHRTTCTKCDGKGCRACKQLGFVSKPPSQIIAETIQTAEGEHHDR